MMVRSVNGTERHKWKLGEEANKVKKEEMAGGGVERTWLGQERRRKEGVCEARVVAERVSQGLVFFPLRLVTLA
jgi:hypothetical protein